MRQLMMYLKGIMRGNIPGEAGISINLITDAGETATVKLANFYYTCHFNDKTPKAWENATIVLIHKKRIERIKNYQPISLLSDIFKLFTKVITVCISDSLGSNQSREPAGFRCRFSADHIHTLTKIREK